MTGEGSPFSHSFRSLDHLDKAQTGRDRVDIHKDLALTEAVNEAVVEATSIRGTSQTSSTARTLPSENRHYSRIVWSGW